MFSQIPLLACSMAQSFDVSPYTSLFTLMCIFLFLHHCLIIGVFPILNRSCLFSWLVLPCFDLCSCFLFLNYGLLWFKVVCL